LRNRVFYSLAEVNAAIAECLADLNDQRVLRQFGKTRRALFTEIDAPNLKSLPAQAWMHAEWRRCRVGLDYHVEIERHFYSVPCSHARREVEARLTVRTVEIFLGGERIAVHQRGSSNGHHTTVAEHMPPSHRAMAEWTPIKIRSEAARIGPMLALLVEKIIESRKHPQQAYRSCIGILRLERRFGAARLEAAALRALEIQARSYPSIKSILEKRLDQAAVTSPPAHEPIQHDNIRGPTYYH
jgi:transposase